MAHHRRNGRGNHPGLSFEGETSGVMPGPASLTEGAHGPNRDWGSIGRTPLHSTIAPRLERPCQVAGYRRARRSGAVRRRGLLQPRSPCPRALPPADRPRRDRDRGLRGAGAPARTHHRPIHAAGVPRRGGAPPRGAHRDQRPPRALQPTVALRQHPGARAHRRGGGPRLAGEHGGLLRAAILRVCVLDRGVPAHVLADRAPPQRGHPGRRPVRHPGRGRRRALAGRRHHDGSPGNPAVRRRKRRGPHGPFGPEAPGFGRPAGGLSRRRSEPRRWDRRRAARLRRPRVDEEGRRRDRCPDAAHHDAECSGSRGAPRRRGRPGPPARCPDRSLGDRPARRQRRCQPRAEGPRRGSPPAADGHGACRRGRGDHPRPDRPHHRRGRVDRVRAGAAGLRARTAPPGPRRPGGEPPLPGRSESWRPGATGGREAASSACTSRTWPAAPRWSA